MAARGRRTRKRESSTAETSATPALEGEDQARASEKVPSHVAHHRIMAHTLNNLIAAFNELSKDTRDARVAMKRDVKRLDSDVYHLTEETRRVLREDERLHAQFADLLIALLTRLCRTEAEVDTLWHFLAEHGYLEDEAMAKWRERARVRAEERLAEVLAQWDALVRPREGPKVAHTEGGEP